MGKKIVKDYYIPLAYRSFDQVKVIVEFLKEKGFHISEYLLNHIDDKRYIPALIVDVDKNELRTTSGTIMACWCSSNRKPLYIDEFIPLYERLIVKKDYKYYNHIVRINYYRNKKPHRPK